MLASTVIFNCVVLGLVVISNVVYNVYQVMCESMLPAYYSSYSETPILGLSKVIY